MQTLEEVQLYWAAKIEAGEAFCLRMKHLDDPKSVTDPYDMAVHALERTKRYAAAALSRFASPEEVVVEVPAPVVEPEPPAAPYIPDFTIIPDHLAKYAEADESAEDFRKRAFSILFRFGIAEGENFEGGGEPLSPEEKIRLLPMLIANFAAGNWLNLTEDLKP